MAAEFAVGSDFASHARHFGGEDAELLNHRVHDVCGPQELTFERAPINVQTHRLGQIALRHGSNRSSHFGIRSQQVLYQRVYRNLHFAPGATRFMELGAFASTAFLSHHLADTFQFLSHLLVRGDNLIKCVGYFTG